MTTEKTAIALRVLTAVNLKQQPDPKDVALLRAYCPEGSALDADELACMVIQEVTHLSLVRRERLKSVGAA